MRKKIIFFLISLFFFLLFVGFSYLVKEDLFTRFDFDTTVRLQNHIPKKVDPFFSTFSLLGSFELTTLLLLILVLWQRRIFSFIAFFIFAGVHLIEIIFKALLDHPGPPYMFFRYEFDFIFPSSYVKPGGSYPSGHMMRTIFLSTIIFYLIWRSKKNIWVKLFFTFILFAIDLIMMISRVSLGEHWMSDVLGGGILGLAAGVVSLIFFERKKSLG
jgi:undecaprenyl-diphosphatase